MASVRNYCMNYAPTPPIWNSDMFLLAFLDLTRHAQRPVSILISVALRPTYWPRDTNIEFIFSVTICEQKAKDFARLGSSQNNLPYRCFHVWWFAGFHNHFLLRFTPVSLLVKFATLEFASFILGSLPIVQNLHFWRGKLKRRRNIKKHFFSRD